MRTNAQKVCRAEVSDLDGIVDVASAIYHSKYDDYFFKKFPNEVFFPEDAFRQEIGKYLRGEQPGVDGGYVVYYRDKIVGFAFWYDPAKDIKGQGLVGECGTARYTGRSCQAF